MKSDERQSPRAPLALQVHYRTTGSFLVSYSLNLSKGGIFIETDQLLAKGTDVVVRFTIPQTAEVIEAEAKVVWVRPLDNRERLPPGVGLQFRQLDERLGRTIDLLAQDFSGMRLLTVVEPGVVSDRLTRYLKSIFHCEVVACQSIASLQGELAQRADLILVDLDTAQAEALAIGRVAAAVDPPLPVIALTRDPAVRDQALQQGFPIVLRNPPLFDELRQQVLDVLGRPWRTT